MKLAICCLGMVGKNFVDIIDLCGFKDYILFDSTLEEHKSLKVFHFERSKLQECDLFVICTANSVLQERIVNCLLEAQIKREHIRIYNDAYYMEVWMRDIVADELTERFQTDIIKILQQDDFMLSLFTKELENILDSAPKYERDSAFYDEMYMTSEEYRLPYQKSCYYPIWFAVAQYFQKTDLEKTTILDIGCGNGTFAQMLFEYGIKHYHGVDFSQIALAHAKEKFLDITADFSFTAKNILEIDFSHASYTHATILEVLEHIEHDRELLQSLPHGFNLIASVPNFHSEGHVRVFKTKESIEQRYGDIVNIQELIPFEIDKALIFLLIGTIK